MDYIDYLNILGVALTAVGTSITIWQAHKAKMSASFAKTYRDEVAKDRGKMALIELLPNTKRVREECRKIIRPVSERSMRGVDPQKVINNIQNFIEQFEEISCRLRVNEFDKSVSNLKSRVSDYRLETDSEKRFLFAEDIYNEVNNIASLLAKQISSEL